jgi:hypothetical protein
MLMDNEEKLYRRLPELRKLRELSNTKNELVQFKTLGQVKGHGKTFPLISVEIGNPDSTLPSLGLWGGVHGIEKIGTQVILAFLNTTIQRLEWDKDLQNLFRTCRIISLPIINPVGMAYNTRSNGNGVDLMRNAPIDSDDERSPLFVSGHRLSPMIPWYRGNPERGMEIESQVLCDYVEKECFPSTCHISIDFHSGFGMRDRLWYPFAKSRDEYPRLAEVKKIKKLLDSTFPHHIYKVEPQSLVYTTHGDLWDYLFLKHENLKSENSVFLPWTLEMGSWLWLKKNPMQIFNPMGLYNPIKEHRHERIMRRHLLLLDFLLHLTRNPKAWLNQKMTSTGS